MNAKNIHFKIINLNLAFVLFLVLFSNLPHQSVPILSWLNCALYFLICLQCLFISLRDNYNKDVFFNIGLLCFVYSLSFVNVFVGDDFLFGDNLLSIYVFQCRTILLRFLLALCISYICVKYMFERQSVLKNYLMSIAVIFPVFMWHFYPFFMNLNYLVTLPDYEVFDKSILVFTFFSFFFVCFYGILLYRTERSLGEHINSLMVCFFIMTLLDITDSVGYIYKIRLLSLSQYVLLIILSFFIITLFRKLNSIYSEFGQFYEHLMISGNHFGVPIKRKKSPFVFSFLNFLRAYFDQRRNSVAFIMFVFVFCLNYFDFDLFFKINVLAVSFATLVLFFYISALYHKRVNSGDFLALRRRSGDKRAGKMNRKIQRGDVR